MGPGCRLRARSPAGPEPRPRPGPRSPFSPPQTWTTEGGAITRMHRTMSMHVWGHLGRPPPPCTRIWGNYLGGHSPSRTLLFIRGGGPAARRPDGPRNPGPGPGPISACEKGMQPGQALEALDRMLRAQGPGPSVSPQGSVGTKGRGPGLRRGTRDSGPGARPRATALGPGPRASGPEPQDSGPGPQVRAPGTGLRAPGPGPNPGPGPRPACTWPSWPGCPRGARTHFHSPVRFRQDL